jgi:hypothetical protein
MIQRRVVRGDPIRVGRKEIVPEAQVTWWMRHHATIGAKSTSGWGMGVVSIRPRAIIEHDPDHAGRGRRVPVRDETARMLMGLAAGALFVWFLAETAVRLATQRGGWKR